MANKNDVLTIKDGVVTSCEKNAVNVEIPAGVTKIDRKAFSGCESLTSVVIPETVTEIEALTFAFCPSLKSVEFRGTKAQWDAVKHKVNLFSFSAAKIKAVKCSDSVWEKPILLVEDGSAVCLDSSVTNVVIPEGVKEIANGGFFGCKRISSVEFGGTVAQWEEIEKGEHWNDGVPAKFVKCSDGDVAL
ncbi:leucine-rich repeat domain-containing protein [Treponema ruminis]|uniref:Leucine-rich repeat domain-containing protein n=1 Tax=Treponema ruminis TaxID=744515 RepID=A0A7W8GAI8_9SPIR|nr:leucine-rich repeat domain-containing protein [Treponema ruminis]MBB5226882.1 hypothetical protein [Treponema ruminis]QSI01310.1 leucine-rich repeat domain-containing protein [Treponema ruminis]